MPLTLPYPTFTAGTVIDPTAANANNAAITAKFAAGIANGDLSATAGIAVTKLAAYYEHLNVNMIVRPGDLAAGWPGGNVIVAAVPVPGVNGDTAWEATSATWCCTDTGAGTGTFDIIWSYFNGGAFTLPGTPLLAAPTAIANGAGAGDSNDGTSTLTAAAVSLAFSANSPHHLVLRSITGEAGTLAGANLYDFLSVTVRLRRPISAS